MKRRLGLRLSSTTDGLPVAPSFGPALVAENLGGARRPSLAPGRMFALCGLAILIAFATGIVAVLLTHLIDLITNLAFLGRISLEPAAPADAPTSAWTVVVPIVGGLIVGLMARFGSAAIRGHGIPEAMERVLEHQSKIPARLTFLKPLSSAVAIGTGGPFGAEGPIIATGGALGSVIGQILRTSANERKTLLAAGAAAGMAATFGSPVSAVLLAVELLLFELAPRSLIPVVLAATVGAITGMLFRGSGAMFAMPVIAAPNAGAFAVYIVLGGVIGVASVAVTQAVYAVEHAFSKLPIHWMWWPAIGGLAVGLVGLVAPHAMGVGYDNIRGVLGGTLLVGPLAILVVFKLVAWMIALGSGTSGGTLAPLFTIGGGLGALLGMGLAAAFPDLGIDPKITALVGMAAMFAGASRALLASVVFAFETTRQPMGLVPLLGGCGAAYLASLALMRHTIMTRKIAERGVVVPTEVASDPLAMAHVGEFASRPAVTLAADVPIASVRRWLASDEPGALHGGFPVVDADGALVGMTTRREIAAAPDDAAPLRAIAAPVPSIIEDATSMRDALVAMVRSDAGWLPVVGSEREVVGVLTRADVLRAFRGQMDADLVVDATLRPLRQLRR